MILRAFVGEDGVGSIGWVLLPHVADRLGAPCMNIRGLGVREPHRRKGIASALVMRVMARSQALGARFASVGTQLWNAPHIGCMRSGVQAVLHGGGEDAWRDL